MDLVSAKFINTPIILPVRNNSVFVPLSYFPSSLKESEFSFARKVRPCRAGVKAVCRVEIVSTHSYV